MPRRPPRLTTALRREYQTLFETCDVAPRRRAAVDRAVNRIERHRPRYEDVETRAGVPWHFVACVHEMEASGRFDRHLHNGDPLTARTRRVPAGRPREGEPPFTWEESAADALRMKRLDNARDWNLPATLYRLEAYNGWGYRLHHPHVLSPYLWSFSTHYDGGKYVADGRWSETLVSRQCGAAVLLRRMAEREMVELADHDVPSAVVRAADRGEPVLRYSGNRVLPHGEVLQRFLNRLPGIRLRVDGKAGERTSDAFRKTTGRYLEGDPRA